MTSKRFICKAPLLLLLAAFVAGIGVAASTTSSWSSLGIQQQFEDILERTLENLRGLLNETRSIQQANEQEHTYDDKYLLVEFVTLNTWQSLVEALPILGLNVTQVKNDLLLLKKDQNSSTSTTTSLLLGLKSKTECTLLSEQEVDVKGDGVEVTSRGGSSRTSRVLHRVTEYKWQVSEAYEIYLCGGSSCDDDNDENDTNNEKMKKTLQSRSMSTTITTTSNDKPKQWCPHVRTSTVDIGWLLRRMMMNSANADGGFHFKIDRNADSCKTPRRNEQVEDILKFHHRFQEWLNDLTSMLEAIYIPPKYEGHTLRHGGSFLDKHQVQWYAAVPFLENSTVLTAERVELLQTKQQEDVASLLSLVHKEFPKANTAEESMISSQEASLHVFARHVQQLLWMHQQSVELVEDMLRQQLIQALGKEIGDHDFAQYMLFHSQKKLFAPAYKPKPFSVAIRHGNSTPVGSISIEERRRRQQTGGSSLEPVQLLTRRISGHGQPPIRIPINAATSIEITGDRYLSGWIRYEFGGGGSHPKTTSSSSSSLIAHARQFSSLVLLIGTVTGPHTFQPTRGMILQNKDKVLIPLLTETLSSAKEFKDAISSLSPEQQRFARAFRGMQLESSVFGLCVVQLKPQMEKLLNLPPGSLAKEIQLTQDLTTLFVEHHIPADLLSFDGNDDDDYSNNTTSKVALVKTYVESVNTIIKETRQKALDDEKEKAKARKFMATEQVKMMAMEMEMEMEEDGAAEPLMYATAAFAGSARGTTMPTSMPSAAPSVSPSSSSSRSQQQQQQQRANVRTQRQQPPPQQQQQAPEDSADLQEDDGLDEAAGNEEVREMGSADPKQQDEGGATATTSGLVDFTQIPKILDSKLEQYDTDGFLRSMIIKTGETWELSRKANLLVDAKTSYLHGSAILHNEKMRAFDLLDALTRSGNLPIDAAELHVVIGVSHNFANSVMETLYQDNINPIEKAEKSLLMLGAEILGQEPRELIHTKTDLQRLTQTFPELVTL